jgi:hypothetical protein
VNVRVAGSNVRFGQVDVRFVGSKADAGESNVSFGSLKLPFRGSNGGRCSVGGDGVERR